MVGAGFGDRERGLSSLGGKKGINVKMKMGHFPKFSALKMMQKNLQVIETAAESLEIKQDSWIWCRGGWRQSKVLGCALR